MRHLQLPDGSPIPVLGLGTWRLGEARASRAKEVSAVRGAISLGYRLIDTAEMYGEGGAEEVVGQAVADAVRAGDVRREELFVVSKVYPHNASRRGTVEACDRSRKRLALDHIDLYLLHWRGTHPLAETIDGMRALVGTGKTRHWGVSNFDTDDMKELAAVASGMDSGCAANQVYYSVDERGPEFSLLPWMRAQGMPLMAYSPIGQGSLAGNTTLAEIGTRRGLSAAQVALAWVLASPGVIAIPKALSEQHQRDNLAAADIKLTAEELQRIDARFAAPKRKTPLAVV